MIENSAESNRGYQKEEKTGKVINGTDRMGKNWYTEKLEAQFDLDICGSDGIWCHCFCCREVYRHFRFFRKLEIRCRKKQGLIEKDPVQQEDGDSILTYTVKEALCDKNSVQVVVEVTAKERGKYLLAGQDTMNEDPVRNLGIESDKTIGEYAAEKGLDHCKDRSQL